jgi:hypothetical protein
MSPLPDLNRVRTLKTFSGIGAMVAVVVGGFVLFSWAFNLAWLKSPFSSLSNMKPNTALAFVLLGLAFRFQLTVFGKWRKLSPYLSGATVLIGILTLWEYVGGKSLGIDQILFQDNGPASGRMAPVSAMNFVLLGLATFLDTRPGNKSWRAAEWLAIATGITSLLAILGYLYGAISLYAVGFFGSIALSTAMVFFVLSLSVLFSRPENGIARCLVNNGPGGTLARRMMPAVMLIPAVVGWIRLRGQEAGLYDTQFGLALYATSNIIFMIALTWWTANGLWRVDLARKKAEIVVEEGRGE